MTNPKSPDNRRGYMHRTIYSFPPEQMIRKRLYHVATGATYEDIDDEPVKPGYLHIITRMAVENATNAMTQFRTGVFDGTNFQRLHEQKPTVAGVLYPITVPIYLAEGEILRTRCRGQLANDVISVYVDGFFKKL